MQTSVILVNECIPCLIKRISVSQWGASLEEGVCWVLRDRAISLHMSQPIRLDAFIRDETDEYHSRSFSFRFSGHLLYLRTTDLLSYNFAILVRTERSKLQILATGRREHTEKSASLLSWENMFSVETEFTLAKIHLYLNSMGFF